VLDETQHARATVLLRELRHPVWRQWLCRGCGERIDGPFEQCWNCGAAMPA
jgi:rubrerythrin